MKFLYRIIQTLIFYFTQTNTLKIWLGKQAIAKQFRQVILFFLIGLLLTIAIIPMKVYAHNFQISQTSNPGLELVKQGQQSYQLGQFRDTVEQLQQAIKIFIKQEDIFNQAITLSNLSLAYQRLGEWEEAKKAINQCFELLEFNPDNSVSNLSRQQAIIIAPALNIYGGLWYQQGKEEIALDSWRKATQVYQQLNQKEAIISIQINKIQALQSLGLYQQAKEIVVTLEQDINEGSLPLQVKTWRTLGELWQTFGDLKTSEMMLSRSLLIAQKMDDKEAIAESLLSLGNYYRKQLDLIQERETKTKVYDSNPWQCFNNNVSQEILSLSEKASNAYQQASFNSKNPSLIVKAQINDLDLLLNTNQVTKAKQVTKTINVSQLSPGQSSIYAQIKLAKNRACLQQKLENKPNLISWDPIETALQKIVKEAKELDDKRALSYSLGYLGGFYEYLSLEYNQFDFLSEAQQLTQDALLLGQPSQNPDIAYLWQWQLGRIFARQQATEKAIIAYQDTVKTLEKIRGDLLTINTDVQFSFRDNVEPVYRQLIKLILTNSREQGLNSNKLADIIDLIDALQLAELENFLRCDLTSVATNQSNFDTLQEAALIYPVILEDKFYILYKLPNQSINYKFTNIAQTEVENTLITLRNALGSQDNQTFIENSKTVYQWLIKPIENDLENSAEVTTLVFVLDGYLRNIPMAVLYDKDNQEYLVEKKYALALLPSSKLLNLNPPSSDLNILAGGISESLQIEDKNFREIQAEDEIEILKKIAPTESLLNDQFTQNNLRNKLEDNDFSVLHLATHGNFSSDPQETYILAYRELLTANELNNLLEIETNQGINELDLLVLSACQTASGDNRATLGLAGLAVRAGAKSTLASLWLADDDLTLLLIERFYQELTKGVSKGEALHQAQKSLVYQEFGGMKLLNSPYNWGAYVLVGNWQ